MVFYDIFICGRWRFIERIFQVLSFHDLWYSVCVSPNICKLWECIGEEDWVWGARTTNLDQQWRTTRSLVLLDGWLVERESWPKLARPNLCSSVMLRAQGRAGCAGQGSWREESVPPADWDQAATTTSPAQHWAQHGSRLAGCQATYTGLWSSM